MILLDPQARPVIGHRGARAHAPENTLPSFLAAVHFGADAVECDLRLSRDGVLMVCHDPTVDRTTDGRGAVEAMTVAELQRLDAGARFTTDAGASFPWRAKGVRLPRFDELVEALPHDLPLIVELKTPAAAPVMRDAARRLGIAARLIVAGFDAASTRPLRGAGFALGACTSDVAALLPATLLGLDPGARPFQALCIPTHWHGLPLPIAALARAMRRRGGSTHIWTVNEPGEAQRLWRLGVQGIISDDPATILAVRNLGSATS